MTFRVATISSDSTGTSRPTIDPLHRFNIFANEKGKFILLALAAAIAGVFVVAARVYGHDGPSGDSSNGSSASSGQQSGSSDNSTGPPEDNSNSKTSDGSATNSSSTSITVNGKSIHVSQSGTYDKTVDVPGGQVRVSGNSSSSTSGGSATNNSSTNVEVNTNQ